MYTRLKDKVVIITGASSGIGQALALECGRRGSRVVLAARRVERLEEVGARIREFGSETLIVETDVSLQTDCENLIRTTIEHFGCIDVLINNAGISMRALFENAEMDVLRKVIDVNLWGTIYCTHYAMPYLLNSKGSLVGISSVAGFKGLPGRSAYSASKFAMGGFLESLRTENMKRGLHVLVVSPGFTRSEIREKALSANGSPQKFSPRNEKGMMPPEKVAVRTIDAIIHRRRLLILTLEGKLIIALQRLFPTLLDKIVYQQMAKEPNSPFK
jgi:dehydrogenase/reductase SDR family member 7B